MIRTRNLVLVLDTNILPAIIDGQDSTRLDQVLLGWVRAMCREINPPPKGKIVTIAASADMIDDYKAGLRRRQDYGDVAKTLKAIFNGSLSRIVDAGDSGEVRLMLEKVAPKRPASPRRVGDSYDQRFLDVVIHMAESKRWKDRQILLASGDRRFLRDAEAILALGNYKRVHVAPDMDTLEDLFAC